MNSKKQILLTVQSSGNDKFRYGINISDSKSIFKKRYKKVDIILPNIVPIKTKTTCGPSDRSTKFVKGYDLYDAEINNWIRSNDFHIFSARKPTKLNYEYITKADKIVLNFVSEKKY